jgi:hypothetical protein
VVCPLAVILAIAIMGSTWVRSALRPYFRSPIPPWQAVGNKGGFKFKVQQSELS